MSKIAKAITSLVTGLMSWGGVVVASAATHVTAPEWLGLGGVFAGALLVWFVPNTEPAAE